MTREKLDKLWQQALIASIADGEQLTRYHFASLVAAAEREACINIIETYRIPVGNSSAGEMAFKFTYDALYQIRDDIRARGEK